MTPGNFFREYEKKNAYWGKMLKRNKTNINIDSENLRIAKVKAP